MNVSYPKLTEAEKQQVMLNLVQRRKRFEVCILKGKEKPAGKVVLVGDRPGPAAPLEPDYHHTPFYSTKHCSGWLNTLLFKSGIEESDLIWINAFDKDGNPTDYKVLERVTPTDFYIGGPAPIIALGGNAAKWLKKGGYDNFVQTTHPQYHKRFRNSEQYELPELILDFVHNRYELA